LFYFEDPYLTSVYLSLLWPHNCKSLSPFMSCSFYFYPHFLFFVSFCMFACASISSTIQLKSILMGTTLNIDHDNTNTNTNNDIMFIITTLLYNLEMCALLSKILILFFAKMSVVLASTLCAWATFVIKMLDRRCPNVPVFTISIWQGLVWLWCNFFHFNRIVASRDQFWEAKLIKRPLILRTFLLSCLPQIKMNFKTIFFYRNYYKTRVWSMSG